jgi:hypothetical protein
VRKVPTDLAAAMRAKMEHNGCSDEEQTTLVVSFV